MKESVSFWTHVRCFIPCNLDFVNLILLLSYFSPTSHALLSLKETIKKSIDDGKFDCGIFLDLQKTCDTVNHKILLHELVHYGIRGKLLDWFQSYMSYRPIPVCCSEWSLIRNFICYMWCFSRISAWATPFSNLC